ncbi:MAG: hypothetical protein IT200_11030 [Thermoleophilia bacterium]|nr:hypothetical protein [Thermoleophilia bacterium]
MGWTRRAVAGTAAAGLAAAGTGMFDAPASPPGGTVRHALTHTCRTVPTPGGFQVVEITGTARAWVDHMPARPALAAEPHRIRQRIDVRVERRVVGGWRGPRGRLTTDATGRGAANTGEAAVTERVGLTIGGGATWRVRATVRVRSVRDHLPDAVHWGYEVVSPPFSCAHVVTDEVLLGLPPG